MSLSDDLEIEALARRMINRTLPKRAWTHEAHFALALWLLRHRPELTGPDEMRRLITGYNAATGTANTDTGGYHHTITLASMRAASEVLARHGGATPLRAVLDSLMAAPFGRPEWLMAYWSRDVLFGVAARRDWVAPDLAPLPF